jgi:hypothetical protein
MILSSGMLLRFWSAKMAAANFSTLLNGVLLGMKNPAQRPGKLV